MNEATGELVAKEGLVIRRGGQDFKLVRIAKNDKRRIWTAYTDGDALFGLPDDLADFDRSQMTGPRLDPWAGMLGFIVVDGAKAVSLPTEPQARKEVPMARGLLDYFPKALAAVAHVSHVGNQQHNPGQPLHWDKTKSTDHADCILRHMVERGKLDTDGVAHSAKVAWRALAMLETELDAGGAK